MNRINRLFVTNSTDLIEQLFNMFIQKQYGEIIYHTEIARILGFDKTESKYGIYVRKAKDRLIPYGKVLKSIPGVGFIVLKPQQVSGFVYRKYIKKTLNMYDKSEEILSYLQRDNFSEAREKEFQDVQKLNRDLQESTASMIQESGYYSRMDYYNSLDENE